MNENNLTIKRLYDQYTQKDFDYSSVDSVNLNPKREISFDQLDKIAKKLQEVTDNIVLKRIQPAATPVEIYSHALGGETFPQGIPIKKQRLLAQTGGLGNALLFPVINFNSPSKFLVNGVVAPGSSHDASPMEKLLEEVIGLFPMPDLLQELDHPIILDCEYILKKFEFDDAESEVYDLEDGYHIPTDSGEGGDSSGGGSGEDGGDDDSPGGGGGPDSPGGPGGDGGDGDDGYGDGGDGADNLDDGMDDDDGDDDIYDESPEEKAEREMRECTEIEMTWLKMLLILVKLIKILKIIIELIMAIIFPLIDILHLASGAWINPPNIPMIAQKVLELIVALIVKLIGMITQLIWDMLNLDCVADQTADIIEQIRRAISMFKSIMNAFNPTAVNMLAGKLKSDIMDPLEEIMADAKGKKEAWAAFGAEMKEKFQNGIDIKKAGQDMQNAVMTGVKTGLANSMGKFNDTADRLKGSLGDLADEADGVFDAMMDAKAGLQLATAMVSKSSGASEQSLVQSPQFDIEDYE